jgi:hypothetical protein
VRGFLISKGGIKTQDFLSLGPNGNVSAEIATTMNRATLSQIDSYGLQTYADTKYIGRGFDFTALERLTPPPQAPSTWGLALVGENHLQE